MDDEIRVGRTYRYAGIGWRIARIDEDQFAVEAIGEPGGYIRTVGKGIFAEGFRTGTRIWTDTPARIDIDALGAEMDAAAHGAGKKEGYDFDPWGPWIRAYAESIVRHRMEGAIPFVAPFTGRLIAAAKQVLADREAGAACESRAPLAPDLAKLAIERSRHSLDVVRKAMSNLARSNEHHARDAVDVARFLDSVDEALVAMARRIDEATAERAAMDARVAEGIAVDRERAGRDRRPEVDWMDEA